MLSDEVLLEIFDFCQQNYYTDDVFEELTGVWDWHILVHVCQRWRQVVFASPLRLNLQIRCTYGTPVRKNLDIWPTLPISIQYLDPDSWSNEGIYEDAITALEHPDRVSAIGLWVVTGQQLQNIFTMMHEPFPALTHLALSNYGSNSPALPPEFLGGSAPCLQTINLHGIPFPALPTLLLSTSNLVTLYLSNIPQTGYIPPEALAPALATLTRLRYLKIGFQSPASRPAQIYLPPVTRTVLPALTDFNFFGVQEYLEDFIARIDAPLLADTFIHLFNQLFDFEVPRLCQFIERSELDRSTRCSLEFRKESVYFVAGRGFSPPTPVHHLDRCMYVEIKCEGIDWQVSHIYQALNQLSAVLSDVAHVKINFNFSSPELEDIGDIEWLQLLRSLASVQTLIVSGPFTGHLSRALDDSDTPGGMETDVLPALEMLCLEGQPVSSVHKFIAARSESGHPVTTIDTRQEFEERLLSYQNY